LAARTAGYACERRHSFEGRKFMAATLNGKKIAFLVAPEGVEQQSFDRPKPAGRSEADVVGGRTITSWPSRKPDHLSAFCDGLVAAVATDKSSPNSATRMLRRL
jgi:hypothetical protein